MPSAENTAAAKKRKDDPAAPDRVIFLVVIFVIATVPALTFLFSFGNVGDLGVSLNVGKRIAYLTGPAIDLSVVGLIVAGSYLSHRGWSEKQLWPIHLMSVVCGLTMIALNCGQAVYKTQYRLAAFDAVGPLLLIGWGFIGPWLLRQLFDARTDGSVRAVSTRKAASTGSAVDRKPDVDAAVSASASTASPAAAGSGSPAGSPAPSTGRPAVAKANGAHAGSRTGSGPIPINRADRLKIVRELIDDSGGDPKKLPLKVIEQRFGVSQATASRMRDDASKPAAPAAQPTVDEEPERAWAVTS